jgi:hypothetical protein
MTYSPNKGLNEPANNSYINTWDVPVNSNWSIIDSAFGGTFNVSLSSTTVTLTQANVQNVYINLTGVLTANVTVNFPAGVSGFYIVGNATSGAYTVTLASAGGGGATVIALQGVNTFIWSTGTNIYLAANAGITVSSPLSLTGSNLSLNTVPVSNGGTGTTSYTDGQLLIGNSATSSLTPATLTAGANITITNGNGTITIASTGGGGGGFDPTLSYSFTGVESFLGTSANLAMLLRNAGEAITISSTAATGTINFDVTTQSVVYNTLSATGNWTINFRGSSGTPLNSIMNTGQVITVAHLVQCGSPAYYASTIQVDGVTVTPVWQGGVSPASGYPSSLNVYTYTIIKQGSGSFVILGSQTQFS